MSFLLAVLLIIQLYYWLNFFRKLEIKIPKSQKTLGNGPGVSIIICSKDALLLLTKNLPKLKNQVYHKYEIIICDDFSTDGTRSYVDKWKNEWKEIFPISYHKVTKNKAGKKQAITEGMQIARHNWVLHTDADCTPVSVQWIKQMMISAKQDERNTIVLGYSPYRWGKTYLSQWVHFEAWVTAVQYLSFAICGRPYMGVGRNMAYTKDLVTPEMLEKYAHLASGDDDLTIMQIANKHNTTVCLDPQSFVLTDPPDNWKSYGQQKRRHYSTAGSYKMGTKALLAGYSLSQILFFLVGGALVYSSSYGWAIACYALRMVVLLPIAQRLIKTLDAKFSWRYFVLFDIVQAFYYLIFSFTVLLPQKNKW